MRLLGSIVGVGLLAGTLAPSPAAAQDRITLEIRDHGGGAAAETVRLSLPLVPRGTSRVETRVGSADHHVSVSHDEARSTIHFEVRRVDVERGPTRGFTISVGVALRAGSRAVIAHLRRPDGTITEIVARRTARDGPRPTARAGHAQKDGSGWPDGVSSGLSPLCGDSPSLPARPS